jgi:hypothetical protein
MQCHPQRNNPIQGGVLMSTPTPALRSVLATTPSRAARGRVLRAAQWLRRDPWRERALVAIKTAHSSVFFIEELSVGYLLFSGLTKRQNRMAALAAATVAAESAIYFFNGRRCPLTGMAEALGAEHGAVTDIYLPRWIAARIFTYNAPLIVTAALLHARVFLARRSARRAVLAKRTV